MDWNKITNNTEVKKLLEQRKEIEEKIKSMDKNALIMYELEALSTPNDIQKLNCIYCDSGQLVCELCEKPLEKLLGNVCENTMCERHK